MGGLEKFPEGWWRDTVVTGPYPFLLMSLSPRDCHEVRTLQHVPHTSPYQRSHVCVRRRVVPTGTAKGDAQVPESWCAPVRTKRGES